MRLVILAALVTASTAHAGVVAGTTFGLDPVNRDEGALSMWAGGEVGVGYIGGELSMGSFVTDGGVSVHVLGGLSSRLSDRVRVLADVGAGFTSEVKLHIGLGDEEGFETTKRLPSGAARVQLVGELGTRGGTTVGVALTTEARIAFEDGGSDTGAGVGIGLVFAR